MFYLTLQRDVSCIIYIRSSNHKLLTWLIWWPFYCQFSKLVMKNSEFFNSKFSCPRKHCCQKWAIGLSFSRQPESTVWINACVGLTQRIISTTLCHYSLGKFKKISLWPAEASRVSFHAQFAFQSRVKTNCLFSLHKSNSFEAAWPPWNLRFNTIFAGGFIFL